MYPVSNHITTQNLVPASYIPETIYILYPLHTCNSLVKKRNSSNNFIIKIDGSAQISKYYEHYTTCNDYTLLKHLSAL